jgi:hypothetical protein
MEKRSPLPVVVPLVVFDPCAVLQHLGLILFIVTQPKDIIQPQLFAGTSPKVSYK